MTRPRHEAQRLADRASEAYAFDFAWVVGVPEDGEGDDAEYDQSHRLLAEPLPTQQAHGPDVGSEQRVMSIVVPTVGDVTIPPEGSLVLIGRFRGRDPIVLGTMYTPLTQPNDHIATDRTIYHPESDSYLRFRDDDDEDEYHVTVHHEPSDSDVIIDDADISIDHGPSGHTIEIAEDGTVTLGSAADASLLLSEDATIVDGNGDECTIQDTGTQHTHGS